MPLRRPTPEIALGGRGSRRAMRAADRLGGSVALPLSSVLDTAMPEPSISASTSLQFLVLLRYLLPALLFLFVLYAVGLMARDLGRFGRARRDAGLSEGPAELLVIQGESPAVGERFRLQSSSITLGRDPTADIPLTDEFASAQHAQLVRHEGEYYVVDLGSTNGTSLNGRRLTDSTYLAEGDEIEIGETVLRFVRTEGSGRGSR